MGGVADSGERQFVVVECNGDLIVGCVVGQSDPEFAAVQLTRAVRGYHVVVNGDCEDRPVACQGWVECDGCFPQDPIVEIGTAPGARGICDMAM